MSREFVFFVSALSFLISGEAQIVTIEPAFFTIDSTITVTFDASKGNRGLLGVDQVYAHTGVITVAGGAGNWQNVQGVWGTDDPQVKMTAIGNNQHQLTLHIKEFYGLSANENVIQLAFVFRNVDGSREGKTSSAGDIFIDIPENNGFNAFFQTPIERQIVVEMSDSLLVDIVASQDADISLFDNDVVIGQATGRSLKLNYLPEIPGNHNLRFEARAEGQISTDSISILYHPVTPIENLPTGMKMGLNRISESEVIIALKAPEKSHVILLSNINDYIPKQEFSMTLALDEETWWIKLENLNPDEDYHYQFLIDGNLKIADPLSELVLDPVHDGAITNYKILPDYPAGKTEDRVTFFRTNKVQFDWTDDQFKKPQKENLIIYELLLRDFLNSRSYLDLKDTLTYLHQLGVNAIELMPIQEFEANDSWGYNPSFHMALDKYYGSPEDFKDFVNQAHELGIAVIQDVVFNHAFRQSPLVQMYWDKMTQRPSSDSPYFNQVARHPFNVGFDFNHESEYTKGYVKRVLQYWMEEYHIDGFRFDLSKGFTQKLSSDDAQMSAYDPSRIAILKEYAQAIWSQDEEAYVILEHFASNTEERELGEKGMLLWSNGNFNFNEATMGYHEEGKSDFSFLSYKQRGFSTPRLINYMESHDEERLMYKNLEFGNSSENYSVQNRTNALQRNELAAIFFFSIPGPKMIWQFGELGYDFSINRCVNGQVGNCRLDPKPVRWDYRLDNRRKQLFEVYRQMIELNKTDPLFTTRDFSLDVAGVVKTIRLREEDRNAMAVGNFDVREVTKEIVFDHDGLWYDFFSGDSLLVTNRSVSLTMSPGQYFLFFDDKMSLTTSIPSLESLGIRISLFPNPTSQFVNLIIEAETGNSLIWELISAGGEIVLRNRIKVNSNSKMTENIDLSSLSSGLYYIRIFSNDGSSVYPISVTH